MSGLRRVDRCRPADTHQPQNGAESADSRDVRPTWPLVVCTLACVAGLAAPAGGDANRASDPRGDLLQGCTQGAPVVGTPAGFDLAGVDGIVSHSGDVTLHVRTYGNPARFLADDPDSAAIEIALRVPGHGVVVLTDERHLGVHRTTIAENNSPVPGSRIFFHYEFFNGSGLVTAKASGLVTITGGTISGNKPVEVMGVKSFAMTNAKDERTFVCDQMLDANLRPIVALAAESTPKTVAAPPTTAASPGTTVAAAPAAGPAKSEHGSGVPWIPIGAIAGGGSLAALELLYRRLRKNPRFCPDRTLTRGEMAVFIIRGEMNSVFPTVTVGASTNPPAQPAPPPAPQSAIDQFGLFADPSPNSTDAPATHPYYSSIQKLRELRTTENPAGPPASTPPPTNSPPPPETPKTPLPKS